MPKVMKIGSGSLFVIIPKEICLREKIKDGNIVDIIVKNPNPEYVAAHIRGNNFHKVKEAPNQSVA